MIGSIFYRGFWVFDFKLDIMDFKYLWFNDKDLLETLKVNIEEFDYLLKDKFDGFYSTDGEYCFITKDGVNKAIEYLEPYIIAFLLCNSKL